MSALQFTNEADFEASPVVRRARSQIARLQAVIDYGEGDIGRAVQIRDILEGSILHCREHEAIMAVRGQDCQLSYTLNDWSPAVNGVCWLMDNAEREAAE